MCIRDSFRSFEWLLTAQSVLSRLQINGKLFWKICRLYISNRPPLKLLHMAILWCVDQVVVVQSDNCVSISDELFIVDINIACGQI